MTKQNNNNGNSVKREIMEVERVRETTRTLKVTLANGKQYDIPEKTGYGELCFDILWRFLEKGDKVKVTYSIPKGIVCTVDAREIRGKIGSIEKTEDTISLKLSDVFDDVREEVGEEKTMEVEIQKSDVIVDEEEKCIPFEQICGYKEGDRLTIQGIAGRIVRIEHYKAHN